MAILPQELMEWNDPKMAARFRSWLRENHLKYDEEVSRSVLLQFGVYFLNLFFPTLFILPVTGWCGVGQVVFDNRYLITPPIGVPASENHQYFSQVCGAKFFLQYELVHSSMLSSRGNRWSFGLHAAVYRLRQVVRFAASETMLF